MTAGPVPQNPIRNAFDEPRAIIAALLVGTWGNFIFMSGPFLVGSLVDTAGYSEQHAGWIFAADMIGLAVGSILTYFLVNRVDRRHLAAAGLAVLIASNLLATAFHELGVLFAIRVPAGLGSGILYSVSIANLSGTHRTARNFSILLFLILLAGSVEALLLPALSAEFGVNGIFMFFVTAGVLALPFVRWLCPFAVERSLVATAGAPESTPGPPPLPRSLPLLYLASIVVYTILIGAVWTYIERAGISAGIQQATVARILAIANLCGVFGALAAPRLSRRWGQGRMLLGALFCVAIVFAVIGIRLGLTTYFGGLVVFNVLWVMVNVYQMGTLAIIDHTGRYGTLVPAAQDIAVSAGSPIAGAMLAAGAGYPAVMFFGAACALLAMLVFLPAYVRLRRLAPAIADAP